MPKIEDIVVTPKPETKHVQATRQLLLHALSKGWTLEYCASTKIMNRKINTLKRYVRRFGMTFPDYKPRGW